MTEPNLPDDLIDLERRLSERPRSEPSPELRGRVLSAIRRRGKWGWRAWASVAAAALLGINLSMSLAAGTDWRLMSGAEPTPTSVTLDRLRELMPDLPEAELRRQSLLARAAADLPPGVQLTPGRQPLHILQESNRWEKR